jgi:hypothetical protein
MAGAHPTPVAGLVARLYSVLAVALAATAAYFAAPSPKDLPGWTQLCLCACGLLLLVVMMSRLALQHFFGPVGSQVRIELLLAAILLSVLLFAFAYHTVANGQSGQFLGLHTRLDALYFSLSTVTTAGAGNISPIGQLARSLVTAQLIFDMAMVTTAVSVVSGRLQSRKARREANHGA